MSTVALPLIIGHSHAGALFDAAAAARIATNNYSFWLASNAYEQKGKHVILGADLMRHIKNATMVISAIGGGSCRVLALASVKKPFDFLHPAHPKKELDDQSEIIPYAAVRDALLAQEALPLAILRAVVEASTLRVVHIIPPSPTRMWEGPGARELTKRTAALLGINDGPEIESHRIHSLTLALWSVMIELHRETCTSLGIEVIDQPAHTRDEHGYLRPEYAQDPMHGNDQYGLALIDRLGLLNDKTDE